MKHLKNERGFTLIEVVASLVIITIVLISFSQLFVQSNKTANYNNEKLVLINLAHAELERMKLVEPTNLFGNSTDRIRKPTSSPTNYCDAYITSTHYCDKRSTKTSLNNRDYNVEIVAKQNSKENKLQLISVEVTVKSNIGKSKSSVEGYVEYD